MTTDGPESWRLGSVAVVIVSIAITDVSVTVVIVSIGITDVIDKIDKCR